MGKKWKKWRKILVLEKIKEKGQWLLIQLFPLECGGNVGAADPIPTGIPLENPGSSTFGQIQIRGNSRALNPGKKSGMRRGMNLWMRKNEFSIFPAAGNFGSSQSQIGKESLNGAKRAENREYLEYPGSLPGFESPPLFGLFLFLFPWDAATFQEG